MVTHHALQKAWLRESRVIAAIHIPLFEGFPAKPQSTLKASKIKCLRDL